MKKLLTAILMVSVASLSTQALGAGEKIKSSPSGTSEAKIIEDAEKAISFYVSDSASAKFKCVSYHKDTNKVVGLIDWKNHVGEYTGYVYFTVRLNDDETPDTSSSETKIHPIEDPAFNRLVCEDAKKAE